MALVQLLLKTPPLDKLSSYITAVAYGTNYEPVPTFQTVEYGKIEQNWCRYNGVSNSITFLESHI